MRAVEYEEQPRLSMFEAELVKANLAIDHIKAEEVPGLFSNIPLGIFGELLLEIPDNYDRLKAYFPSMASQEVQNNWTGSHGKVLLRQSEIFARMLVSGYAATTGRKIADATILDYGCGWGRLIRLLYKYSSIENIYGVDPWGESIRICRENKVGCHLAISDYVPDTLPFDHQFDLIFAFSVFTHLSEKTTAKVLNTLRNYISPSGMLAITIRPKEYWEIHQKGKLAAEMTKMHEQSGFAFTPHHRDPIDGDITYGDSSISLEYLADNFPRWNLVSAEWDKIDPYQVVLFFLPE